MHTPQLLRRSKCTTNPLNPPCQGDFGNFAKVGVLIHHKVEENQKMNQTYTALIQQRGDWWIGWIEEIPGVNCQEKTREAA